jgi:hypothetical protein
VVAFAHRCNPPPKHDTAFGFASGDVRVTSVSQNNVQSLPHLGAMVKLAEHGGGLYSGSR